jgi:hypothetical protein
MVPTAESFLALLGLKLDDPRVRASLDQFAHGMEPELDPEDDESFVDWVTVYELGLEYGFEDEAYLRALDPSERRRGPLILDQFFFYAETETMRAYPFALPFRLALGDDRATVRRKLAHHENVRRSYVRDFWALPGYNMAITYGAESRTIEIVNCYLPYAPWPEEPGPAQLAADYGIARLCRLFGLKWSSEKLRSELAPLGYDAVLPGVRSEHTADFRLEHGLELVFAPAQSIPAADQSAPMSLVVVGATFYSARHEDAREWAGELPLGLRFEDTPQQLRDKVGKKPAESDEEDLSGTVVWHFPEYTLNVLYSTLENRLVAITIFAPGFWSSTGAAGVA